MFFENYYWKLFGRTPEREYHTRWTPIVTTYSSNGTTMVRNSSLAEDIEEGVDGD